MVAINQLIDLARGRRKGSGNGYLMIDAIVALTIMIAGILTASTLLIQFRLAEKRQERDWIAAQELQNIAESMKAIPYGELQELIDRFQAANEDLQEIRISERCHEWLKEPILAIDLETMESQEESVQGVRIDLSLTWLESQQRIGKPKSLSIWRFNQP